MKEGSRVLLEECADDRTFARFVETGASSVHKLLSILFRVSILKLFLKSCAVLPDDFRLSAATQLLGESDFIKVHRLIPAAYATL